MMELTTLAGILRYEYAMQVRRRALWLTFIIFGLFILTVLLLFSPASGRDAITHLSRYAVKDVVAFWASNLNTVLPIFVGVLLADRLPRDRKTKVEELLRTTPNTLRSRVLGKYLGSTLATLTPVLVFFLLGIVYILVQTGNPMTLVWALATFLAIMLPGMLFIAAFSVGCPVILWVPVYQFLFVGYWFWGNLFPPATGIPTLSDTILTPLGGFAGSAFFNAPFAANTSNQIPPASTALGVASIVLLLAIAFLVIVALWGLLKWQQSRQ